ncbi:MAG: carbonic anhydrase family protein [Magnetococcales bacterium]|nr:carbonic anhydrase family protein [Magnetococcales bacterium]
MGTKVRGLALPMLFLGGALGLQSGIVVAGEEAKGSGAHWGYEGETGPANWGKMGFPACAEGKNQSPIDINAAAEVTLDPIRFDYKPAPLQVVNNGHTIQFNLPPGSTITIGGKSFTLAQFHFHGGSEHTVKGKGFPMELHLVHKAEDGELAVVGILLAAAESESAPVGHGAAANPTLERVFGALPAMAGLTLTSDQQIDPAALLPHDRAYFHYKGSLTTPPCSEGVNWFVMGEPVTITRKQLLHYTSVFDNNARPPQPLHSRNLYHGGKGGAAAAGH